jgi:hypothetical protein
MPKLERQQQQDASWRQTRLRPVDTRSGKLTRPLPNDLTPFLIDFLQRDPFANGVSYPSVASEPVDVTLPDLIAAPRSQHARLIPGYALGAHRPKDPDPSFHRTSSSRRFP